VKVYGAEIGNGNLRIMRCDRLATWESVDLQHREQRGEGNRRRSDDGISWEENRLDDYCMKTTQMAEEIETERQHVADTAVRGWMEMMR